MIDKFVLSSTWFLRIISKKYLVKVIFFLRFFHHFRNAPILEKKFQKVDFCIYVRKTMRFL